MKRIKVGLVYDVINRLVAQGRISSQEAENVRGLVETNSLNGEINIDLLPDSVRDNLTIAA